MAEERDYAIVEDFESAIAYVAMLRFADAVEATKHNDQARFNRNVDDLIVVLDAVPERSGMSEGVDALIDRLQTWEWGHGKASVD